MYLYPAALEPRNTGWEVVSFQQERELGPNGKHDNHTFCRLSPANRHQQCGAEATSSASVNVRHGGEAQQAKDAFTKSSAQDKADLICLPGLPRSPSAGRHASNLDPGDRNAANNAYSNTVL